MKKLFVVLGALSIGSAFACDYTGGLNIQIPSLDAYTPYLSASANTIKQNGQILAGYVPLKIGQNSFNFNNQQKDICRPYAISFGIFNGGAGVSGGTIGWSGNSGSNYTFSVTPNVYPDSQVPAFANYCIQLVVDGNTLGQPVCSIETHSNDGVAPVWYFSGAVTTYQNVNFNSDSNVQVLVTPTDSPRHATCSGSQWNPTCTFN